MATSANVNLSVMNHMRLMIMDLNSYLMVCSNAGRHALPVKACGARYILNKCLSTDREILCVQGEHLRPDEAPITPIKVPLTTAMRESIVANLVAYPDTAAQIIVDGLNSDINTCVFDGENG